MSNPTGDSPYLPDVRGRPSSPVVETEVAAQTRDTGDDLVGLVLVHGIGEQRPGDTLAKFLAGMEESFPSVDIDLEAHRVGRATLRSGTRSVRVYEAHWAHLLSDGFVEDTFRRDALFEIGWFPLLNHRERVHLQGEYASALVGLWTAVLVPVGVALHLALLGVGTLVRLLDPRGYADRTRRLEAARSAGVQGGGAFSRMVAQSRHAAEIASEAPTRLDFVLDAVVSDVTNYVNSVAGAFPADAPTELREASRRIEDVFRATVAEAVSDGCSEVQVLAHSLGTVVAYRVLAEDGRSFVAPADVGDVSPPPVPITRLLTIGSPLEKIRFIWASILEREAPRAAVGSADGPWAIAAEDFEWHNFSSAFDLVAGRLRRFDLWGKVRNHRTPGLGGLATAHVAYETSPAFMNVLGRGLLGREVERKAGMGRRIGRTLLTIGENLTVPLVFLLVTLAGVAFAFLTGWLASWVVRFPLERLDMLDPTTGRTFSLGAAAFVTAVIALGALPAGRARALHLHAESFSGERQR